MFQSFNKLMAYKKEKFQRIVKWLLYAFLQNHKQMIHSYLKFIFLVCFSVCFIVNQIHGKFTVHQNINFPLRNNCFNLMESFYLEVLMLFMKTYRKSTDLCRCLLTHIIRTLNLKFLGFVLDINQSHMHLEEKFKKCHNKLFIWKT